MPPTAYVAALGLLARQDLSEAQVRRRLARRGYEPGAIDDAVEQLKRERAIDDVRVAAAMARTQATRKGRGRLRVIRAIEQAGIGTVTAQQAADEVFAEVGEDALLQAALARRLRGVAIDDERERGRLYRSLVNQGFEPDRILRALDACRLRGRQSSGP